MYGQPRGMGGYGGRPAYGAAQGPTNGPPGHVKPSQTPQQQQQYAHQPNSFYGQQNYGRPYAESNHNSFYQQQPNTPSTHQALAPTPSLGADGYGGYPYQRRLSQMNSGYGGSFMQQPQQAFFYDNYNGVGASASAYNVAPTTPSSSFYRQPSFTAAVTPQKPTPPLQQRQPSFHQQQQQPSFYNQQQPQQSFYNRQPQQQQSFYNLQQQRNRQSFYNPPQQPQQQQQQQQPAAALPQRQPVAPQPQQQQLPVVAQQQPRQRQQQQQQPRQRQQQQQQPRQRQQQQRVDPQNGLQRQNSGYSDAGSDASSVGYDNSPENVPTAVTSSVRTDYLPKPTGPAPFLEEQHPLLNGTRHGSCRRLNRKVSFHGVNITPKHPKDEQERKRREMQEQMQQHQQQKRGMNPWQRPLPAGGSGYSFYGNNVSSYGGCGAQSTTSAQAGGSRLSRQPSSVEYFND